MIAVGQLYADFSSSKPSVAQLQAEGYAGVIGYASVPDDQSGGGKNISAAQVATYQAAHLDVCMVWETTAQRALSGAAGGTVDGPLAFGQARGRGIALTSVLAFNCGDFAATTAELSAIAAYLAAAIAQCPGQLVGCYGTHYIIDALAPQFPNVIWWENAMDDEGDKGSAISPNANLYQRVAAQHPIPGTDENVVCKAWAVAPPPKENLMAATAPFAWNSQQHVLQVSGGVLWHKYESTAGQWTNEVIAGPGSVAGVSQSVVNAMPQWSILGGQLLITVEDASNFHVLYFAQTAGTSAWGANELP